MDLMKKNESIFTEFQYGTKLREDSSRRFIEQDHNLKYICEKIGPEEVEKRFIKEEFDLLQKMTTTKENTNRCILEKKFKKYYGVHSGTGPYKINAGKFK